MKHLTAILVAFSVGLPFADGRTANLPSEKESEKASVKLLYQRRLSSGPSTRDSESFISDIIIADFFPNQGLSLVVRDHKNLCLLDGMTGNPLWSYEIGPISGRSYWALARLGSDKSWKIIAGDSQGNLHIIDPYSRKLIRSAALGFEVWKVMVSDPDNDGVVRLGIIGRERGARKPYYFTVLDPKQMSPLWTKKGEDVIEASAFVKVDGPHLVVITDDTNVECFEALSGKKLWSHNFGKKSFFGMKLPRWATGVALMRVGGGKVHIVIGTAAGGVFVYDSKGEKLKEADIGGSPLGNVGFIEEISTGDLTADGYPDIVIGSIDHKVYALDGKTMKKLWAYKTGDEVYSSPALADMNNDGVLDVVVVPRDSKVYCINGRDGKLMWKYELPERASDQALVADVNRDGYLDVVVGSVKSSTLMVLTTNARCEKGAILWGKPYGNNQNTREYGVR